MTTRTLRRWLLVLLASLPLVGEFAEASEGIETRHVIARNPLLQRIHRRDPGGRSRSSPKSANRSPGSTSAARAAPLRRGYRSTAATPGVRRPRGGSRNSTSAPAATFAPTRSCAISGHARHSPRSACSNACATRRSRANRRRNEGRARSRDCPTACPSLEFEPSTMRGRGECALQHG